jgi:hypothetical protein
MTVQDVCTDISAICCTSLGVITSLALVAAILRGLWLFFTLKPPVD